MQLVKAVVSKLWLTAQSSPQPVFVNVLLEVSQAGVPATGGRGE